MGAQLVILGTAGDSTTMGKQVVASGGIVLIDDDIHIHVNPGPGSLICAKQWDIPIRNTDVLVMTQNSVLQAGDANALVDAMSLGGLDVKGVVLCPQSVVHPTSEGSPLLSIQSRQFVEKVIVLKSEDKVGIGDIQIIPCKTHRDESECLGYIIKTSRFSIGLMPYPDVSKDRILQYKNCDVLVLLSVTEQKSEDVYDKIVSVVKQSKPKLAVLSGYSFQVLREDPLALAREVQKSSGVQTIAAKDGLAIDPFSHAAKIRQSSLIAFSTR